MIAEWALGGDLGQGMVFMSPLACFSFLFAYELLGMGAGEASLPSVLTWLLTLLIMPCDFTRVVQEEKKNKKVTRHRDFN